MLLISLSYVVCIEILPTMFRYYAAPFGSLIQGAPPDLLSPALWSGGLAGALMVPYGCIGIRRDGGAKWMLCG
jgi:hypothetical protein